MRRLAVPASKLALGAEIAGGVAALLAFCALAGGASPTVSAARRKAKVAPTAASAPAASTSASAVAAAASPSGAPAPSATAPLIVMSAAPSAKPLAVASAVTEPVRGKRPRPLDAGGGTLPSGASPDLDGDRLRIAPGARVLVFGDSMVQAGLAMRLGNLVKARGGTLEFDGWTSSTTAKWATGDRLAKLLERVNPDVVFIALGSNECFLGDPVKAAPNVRAIVAQLAGRQCVWVGPPVWKGETGIVGVERDASSPCAFYDSGKLEIKRYEDGIHPNLEGGIYWANKVWEASVEPMPGAPLARP
jgi:lysophospholipase L1-like esterase